MSSKWNVKEIFKRADSMLSKPYRLIAVCRYKNKNYVFAAYHVNAPNTNTHNPEKFLFEQAPGHMGHWNHFLWDADKCLKQTQGKFVQLGWGWMLPMIKAIRDKEIDFQKGIDSLRSDWIDKNKIYGDERKRLDEFFLAKQSKNVWQSEKPSKQTFSSQQIQPLATNRSKSEQYRDSHTTVPPSFNQTEQEQGQVWQALPLTSINLSELFSVFTQNYFSHFLLQSLSCLVAQVILPIPWGGLLVFFFLISVMISSSERLLTGSPLFEEMSFWRIFYRFLNLCSFMALAPLLGIVAGLPFFFVAAITDQDWIFWLVFIGWTVFCIIRCWPLFVIQYIYRYSEADYWSIPWHIKFPDIALAYRLTSVDKAFYKATLPVLLLTILPLCGYLILDDLAGASLYLKVPLMLGYFFIVLPFSVFVLVERASVLANNCQSAWQGAVQVAKQGNFWFVK